MLFTSVEANGRTFFGNEKNDTQYSARWFTTSKGGYYLDYMRATSSGSSVRRINTTVSNANVYNGQTTTTFLYKAGYNKET